MGRYGGVTAADKDDRMRIQVLGPADALPALGGGCGRDAAGVDDYQIGDWVGLDRGQSQVFQGLANLLAFIMIDLAAQGPYGKSLHGMV